MGASRLKHSPTAATAGRPPRTVRGLFVTLLRWRKGRLIMIYYVRKGRLTMIHYVLKGRLTMIHYVRKGRLTMIYYVREGRLTMIYYVRKGRLTTELLCPSVSHRANKASRCSLVSSPCNMVDVCDRESDCEDVF